MLVIFWLWDFCTMDIFPYIFSQSIQKSNLPKSADVGHNFELWLGLSTSFPQQKVSVWKNTLDLYVSVCILYSFVFLSIRFFFHECFLSIELPKIHFLSDLSIEYRIHLCISWYFAPYIYLLTFTGVYLSKSTRLFRDDRREYFYWNTGKYPPENPAFVSARPNKMYLTKRA